MTRLLQMIGYVISSLEGAEKLFIFCGPSDCGKSVVLNLIEHIISSELTNDDVSESESIGTLGSDENECIILNEESDNDDAKRLTDTITIEADEDELIWE